MDKTTPETNGGRLIKRGRTFDPECGRATHRLSIGTRILAGLGITPTWPEHDEKCILNPKNRSNRVFGFDYHCECKVGSDPTPTWPEWVSGATFDMAYRLADETQASRGAWHQTAINRERAAARAGV